VTAIIVSATNRTIAHRTGHVTRFMFNHVVPRGRDRSHKDD
jgi:hypothetical protein